MGALPSARRVVSRRRRWLRAAPLAAVAVAISVLVPAAGRAVPGDRAALVSASAPLARNPAAELSRLESRAAKLTSLYRGDLVLLTDAENAAKKTVARVVALRGQLDQARREVARLAAASYMDGVQDPTIVILGGGDTQRMLDQAGTLQYLAEQRTAKERSLGQLITAGQRAEQVTESRITDLRNLINDLSGQRHKVAALIAKFQPESPVIGGSSVTPRMASVRDAVDRRFGPFVAIGCWRPGSDDHSQGRACDFMLSTGGVLPTTDRVALGYEVASWAQANASKLGIEYIIYRQKIWDIRMGSSGWVPMEDRGSITANHFDHVHISVF
jgi:hypothetical protein